MIKIRNEEAVGWEHAIRGARNPMNSWAKSDTIFIEDGEFHDILGFSGPVAKSNMKTGEKYIDIGNADYDLLERLCKAGTDHRKFMRMITVYADITAPLFWWKEFDTYKVGTVANSCSTMHKIHEKPFSVNDISCDELMKGNLADVDNNLLAPELKAHYKHMTNVLASLNNLRDLYLKTKDKRYWRCMIEMLPSSYNQKRTVMLNYEVLANIYKSRKNHKLHEWHVFCDWIKSLPYNELITGEFDKEAVECS